jgi:hypothetical protein
MRRSLLYISLILVQFNTWSQNEEDILRMSTTDIFGSARFEAMAGSFGALGADFSAIQINPAGLGRFSSSHFSFSLGAVNARTSSLYNGMESFASNNNVKPGVIGAVFATDKSAENRGTTFQQFSIGWTRLKSFDMERNYEGQNFNSLLDVFANMGYGVTPDFVYDQLPQTTALAYDVYALDFNDNTFEYVSRLTMGDMYHNRSITTDGGIGEFHIGFSENKMNKFYWGIALGIRRINYNEFYHHNEVLLEPDGVTLREFDYMHTLRTRGTGFNLKGGIIYLPSEEFRLGFAFESPTIMNLTDNWFADMSARHDFGTLSIDPQFILEQQFQYRLRTPMRLRPSMAFIINKRGALNVDFEYVDHGRGRLSANLADPFPYSFNLENAEARIQFRPLINTRIGFEYLMTENIFVRGGYALLPQPFKRDLGNVMTPNQTFATGLGLKFNKSRLDISYRALNLRSDYYAFDPSQIENKTEFNTWINSIMFSYALRF